MNREKIIEKIIEKVTEENGSNFENKRYYTLEYIGEILDRNGEESEEADESEYLSVCALDEQFTEGLDDLLWYIDKYRIPKHSFSLESPNIELIRYDLSIIFYKIKCEIEYRIATREERENQRLRDSELKWTKVLEELEEKEETKRNKIESKENEKNTYIKF